MSYDVDFYRDHIDGLRAQLILRDRKIEQLNVSVDRLIKLRADVDHALSLLDAITESPSTEIMRLVRTRLAEAAERAGEPLP